MSRRDAKGRCNNVSTVDFLEKEGHLLGIFLSGILLMVVSTCLIYWNEKRAAQTEISFGEGLSEGIYLHCIDQAKHKYGNKLVDLTGSPETDKQRAAQTEISFDEGLSEGIYLHCIDQAKHKYGNKLVDLTGSPETDKEMFHVKPVNTVFTWFLRVLGFTLTFIAFEIIIFCLHYNTFRGLPAVEGLVFALMSPAVVLLEVIRGLLFATTWSLVTAAIAWITYRPLFSLVLILLPVAVPIMARNLFSS